MILPQLCQIPPCNVGKIPNFFLRFRRCFFVTLESMDLLRINAVVRAPKRTLREKTVREKNARKTTFKNLMNSALLKHSFWIECAFYLFIFRFPNLVFAIDFGDYYILCSNESLKRKYPPNKSRSSAPATIIFCTPTGLFNKKICAEQVKVVFPPVCFSRSGKLLKDVYN